MCGVHNRHSVNCGTMAGISTLLLGICICIVTVWNVSSFRLSSSCTSLQRSAVRRKINSRRELSLRGGDDYAELHNRLFDDINSKLSLKLTDYGDYQGVATWRDGDWDGNVEWFDEAMGAKLTGVSKYSAFNAATGVSRYSIDCWVGPSLLVPHMLLSFGTVPSNDRGLNNMIIMDFVPRGATPFGSDSNYVDKYYGNEVLDCYDDAIAAAAGGNRGDNVHLAPPISFSGRLLSSPVRTAVASSSLSTGSVASFATEHVQRWLDWVTTAEKVEARQRGAINTRDDKLRQYAYRAGLASWNELLDMNNLQSDLIRDLAAGSTGPLAEAYIGGGS